MKTVGILVTTIVLAPAALAQEAGGTPELHGISVERVVAAAGVDDRQPSGEATSFPADVGQVYCFTHVKGAEAGTRITHVWYRDGEEKARVELPVGAASWRTWSSKRILPSWSGDWKVVVLDASGGEIGATSFSIGG